MLYVHVDLLYAYSYCFYPRVQIIEFTSRYDFKVLHTPGHTLESVVYLLVDKLNDNKPLKVSITDLKV